MNSFVKIVTIISISVFGCKTEGNLIENTPYSKPEDAINKAISNFLEEELIESDTVFYITVESPVVYLEVKDSNGTQKFLPKKKYEEIVGVSIIPYKGRYPILSSDYNKFSEYKIASRYIEKNERLFYWDDKDKPVGQDIVSAFEKYGLIYYVDHSYELLPEVQQGLKDEGGVNYYFCKSDLRIYKKDTSNEAMGYYKPPKINCED